MAKSNFSSIESIINDAKKNKMFILVDDEKRENEGDLIIPTTCANTKNINFMAKYGRGLICLALDSHQAKKLNLSLMSPKNESRNKTAFTISIEARKGITTGISAKDRAKTIKVATKKNATKKDIGKGPLEEYQILGRSQLMIAMTTLPTRPRCPLAYTAFQDELPNPAFSWFPQELRWSRRLHFGG